MRAVRLLYLAPLAGNGRSKCQKKHRRSLQGARPSLVRISKSKQTHPPPSRSQSFLSRCLDQCRFYLNSHANPYSRNTTQANLRQRTGINNHNPLHYHGLLTSSRNNPSTNLILNISLCCRTCLRSLPLNFILLSIPPQLILPPVSPPPWSDPTPSTRANLNEVSTRFSKARSDNSTQYHSKTREAASQRPLPDMHPAQETCLAG